MKIALNGTITELADGASVGDLVRERTDERRRVAVARNGEVVRRSEWDAVRLSEGDLIEVLAPVAGG